MLLAAFMCLVTLPLFGMDKDIFELTAYPPEMIDHIVFWLQCKDKVAFTSTCKQLRSFSTRVPVLNLRISPEQHSWWNIICAGGSLAMLYPLFRIVDPHIACIKDIVKDTVYTTACATPPALGVPVVIACFIAIPRLYKKATAALEYINTSEQRVSAQRIAQLATNYYSIAEHLRNGSLTVGTLCIDYYKKSQAQPLLKAACVCGTSKISIQVHALIPSPKEYMRPCCFLAENKRLKNLEITVDDKADTFLSPISIDSFYDGMKRNNALQTLKLTGVALSPRLLDALFSHKPLEELTLSACNATEYYNFKTLAQNSTIKKLSILYFTNHHSCINDSNVQALLDFMKNNRVLESFTLRTCSLSNAAITQLKASPYAPPTLVVP
jgi:hypothetical protein